MPPCDACHDNAVHEGVVLRGSWIYGQVEEFSCGAAVVWSTCMHVGLLTALQVRAPVRVRVPLTWLHNAVPCED